MNAVTLGFVATDQNGHSGVLIAEQGATVPVRAATLPADGPTGRFFSQYGEVPW